jgi:hypothetical protein
MRRNFLIITLLSLLLLTGCAGSQGKPVGDVAGAVVQVAADAPTLAKQLNDIYAYWVAQKAIPDHTAEATRVLAALDAIAPMVQQAAQGVKDALGGDRINWVQFVIQAAITTAQILGYVAPQLL